MSKSSTPELNEKWWSKHKSFTLKPTGLGKALKAYEAAARTYDKDVATADTLKAAQDSYAAVKLALEEVVDVTKKAIGLCDAKRHASDLKSLKTYQTDLIPAEKSRLEELFEKWNTARTNKVEKARKYNLAALRIFVFVGNKSSKAVFDSREDLNRIDDLLNEAARLFQAGETPKAASLGEEAEKIAIQMQARTKEIANDLKDAQKSDWQFDRDLLLPVEDKEFSKQYDERSVKEEQAANNIETLKGLANQAMEMAMETKTIAAGRAKMDEVYLKSMNRLVDRAFQIAQDLDVALRESSGSLDSAEGDIGGDYETLGDTTLQEERRNSCAERLKKAIEWLYNFKTRYKNATKEIQKTLDGFPKETVHNKNPQFRELFEELARANSQMESDAEKAEKLEKKIQSCVINLKKLQSN